MKFRFLHAITALSGLAAGASAQVITTQGISVNLALNWMEDPAFPHNDDGDLDLGEHALIIMTISFTGQNSRVNFSPAVGGFTSGTILGLSSAYIDIRGIGGDASGLYNGGITVPPSTSVGPNNSSAGTSGYGIRGGWRMGGNVANGTPASNGFQNLGPGQLPLSPAGADTTNPILGAERLGWAPKNYAPRFQTFRVLDAAGRQQRRGRPLPRPGWGHDGCRGISACERDHVRQRGDPVRHPGPRRVGSDVPWGSLPHSTSASLTASGCRLAEGSI